MRIFRINKMRSLISIIVALLAFTQFYGVKAEITIVYEDVEPVDMDPEYVTDFDGYLSEDGEGIVATFNVIKNMPDNCMGRLHLMGASMGDYVVDTGVDYTMEFCEMFEEPIIMGRILHLMGFTECPVQTGTYETEKINLDTSTLPDTFPSNSYRAKFVISKPDGDPIFGIYLYLKVSS